MLHPIRWDGPVTPEHVSRGSLRKVPRGAIAAGGVGDALVVVDEVERRRRREAGIADVASLVTLDLLMNLPWRAPVPRSDLDPDAVACLDRLPEGVVQRDGRWVVRLLTPPLTVVAVMVHGHGWRDSLRRAAVFAPFAQRIAVIRCPTAPRRASVAIESQVSGVGLWVSSAGSVVEEVPPEPFRRRYAKPAGWRFAERAYAVLEPAVTSDARAGTVRRARPGRTGAAVSGRPSRVHPLW